MGSLTLARSSIRHTHLILIFTMAEEIAAKDAINAGLNGAKQAGQALNYFVAGNDTKSGKCTMCGRKMHMWNGGDWMCQRCCDKDKTGAVLHGTWNVVKNLF